MCYDILCYHVLDMILETVLLLSTIAEDAQVRSYLTSSTLVLRTVWFL